MDPIKIDLKRGLQNVYVTESKICYIDGIKGRLYYRGYRIQDLAKAASFEEIVYLLLYEKLPNKKELKWITKELHLHRNLSAHIINTMQTYCRAMTAMEALRTTVSALSCGDKDARKVSLKDHTHNAISLIAKFPTIIAYYYRIKRNLEIIKPNNKLSHGANFLYMITGEKPDRISGAGMEMDLVLHAEHGFNASSFASRVTTSTLSDMHSAFTTGIGTLKGPLHGGAAKAVMKMLSEIGNERKVERYVKDKLKKHRRIMGFGHRVYKTYDPRAKILKNMAREISQKKKNMRWFKIAEKLEIVMEREKTLYPNVDFYSSIVYHLLGLPLELDTPIFAMARSAGWGAHCIEQYKDNKLIRPRALYSGSLDIRFIPIGKRK